MISKQTLANQIDKNKLNFESGRQIIAKLAGMNNIDKNKMETLFEEMIKEGFVFPADKGKFASAKKLGYVRGKLLGHSRGYAFLIREDKEEDIFIPNSSLKGAMHEDEVIVKVQKERGSRRSEGQVVKIISHGLNTLVGTIEVFSGFAFVFPDNKKIFRDVHLSKQNIGGAKSGDKVFVKITSFDGKNLEGKVIEVLGRSDGNVTTDVLSIIRAYELIEEFPKEVSDYAKNISLAITPQMMKNREDFRNLQTITIDGDDSKDLDDAVSLEMDDDNYVLGVHIADVGEYVKIGNVLDKEAYRRGTSVYFPNTVLPMLPRELSNGICSLNPKEDRLTLSCVMTIDKSGKIVSHKICESIINTTERMTYGNVTGILENDEILCKRYANIREMLVRMEKLCLILEKVRKLRGSLDFDIPEPKIVLNEETLEVEKLIKKPRTISERMIESFMLIANETVAERFKRLKIPFVYRVHERPEESKLENFNAFVCALNLNLNLDNLTPLSIQKFLEKLKGSLMEEVVNKVLLRCMQKARYSEVCSGHFGLAAPFYCHFTSPIRRYPDLTIHRIIKKYLREELNDKAVSRLKDFVAEASVQSSIKEVAAEKSERDVDDYFKARYMQNKIGQCFTGVISGVTSYGFYVELENTVEGFVSVETLPGTNFIYNEKTIKLSNGISSYCLGNKVEIKVQNVNLADRNIDFILK